MSYIVLTRILLAFACAAGVAPAVRADYPERPIRLIAPIAAGTSALDAASRLIAEKMGPKLGTQVVVINQPGAAGTLAAGTIAKGPKDGYTLNLNTAAAVGYAKVVNRDLPYDPARELTPIALMGVVPVGLFVNANSDIRTLPDLVAAAKAKPDVLNYATPGVGTVSHLSMEMLAGRTDTRLKHVPYGASLAYWNDLMGGTIEVVVGGVTGGLPLVKDLRLRLVSVLGKERSTLAPDVPAAGEVLSGFDVPSWLGLVVAQGTPEPILDVAPLGRKAFAAKLANDLPTWERTLRTAGVAK